jgi:hypothetical protein
MPTIEEIRELQKQPTDFSAFDASAYDDAQERESRYVGDEKLYVQFYRKPVLNEAESVKAGRPIHKDEVFIKIFVPGDKLSQIDRIASEQDIERFRKHYERFVAGQSQQVGTPLSSVGFIPATLVEDLKYFNVHTVEQLASVSDAVAQKISGLQSFKQKAQAYLDATNSPEKLVERAREQVAAEVMGELRKRDQELAELRAQLAKMRKKQEE